MVSVNVTTVSGERYKVACPGVDPSVIDLAWLGPRTPYDIDSFEVVLDESNRIEQLEDATGIGTTGQAGIANRIDDLESRIEDLESQ